MNKNLLIFISIAFVMVVAVYLFSLQQNGLVPDSEGGQRTTADASLVEAIDNDLQNTDVENLDAEFDDIESELDAAISEAQ